ncbi:MAG: hypothetical protein RLZZ584_1443 [Pseudomonadota bacterium]|jgi:hypothetical protein
MTPSPLAATSEPTAAVTSPPCAERPRLAELLAQAWDDHADEPEAVADAFDGWLDRVTSAADAAALARLIAHVCGEHLGQWQRGIGLITVLRDLPWEQGDAATARPALERQIAALACGAGDASAAEDLPLPDQVAALAQASSALAARGEFARAIALFRLALAQARSSWPEPALAQAEAPAAVRALAVAGNNLAAALEEHAGRSGDEAGAMLEAAAAALDYWRVAGGWLEEERAHYRLARSALQAGATPGIGTAMQADATARALAAARACLALCLAHEAPAFERFFAHAVLALAGRAAADVAGWDAARAAAQAAYAQLGDDDRPWCRGELVELGLDGVELTADRAADPPAGQAGGAAADRAGHGVGPT